MRLVVFTAVLGETDELLPPVVVDPDVRYVCFSDQRCDVAPYEWVRVPAADDPKFESRRLKILADHPVLEAADATLWHDASYRLLQRPSWAVQRLTRYDAVAMRHPRRSCIEEEAVAIARYGYVTIDAARAHVARYRADGFVRNVLTSNGLLARHVSPQMRAFNRLWWDEVQLWRGRDQASVDYCAFKAGILIGYVKGTVKHNAFASWRVPMPEAVPA